jgi:hypothetical protein
MSAAGGLRVEGEAGGSWAGRAGGLGRAGGVGRASPALGSRRIAFPVDGQTTSRPP